MSEPVRILCISPAPPVLADAPWGPFDVTCVPTLDEAAAALRGQRYDAVLAAVADAEALRDWPALSHAVLEAAVVAVTPSAAAAVPLLQLGLQDVLPGTPASVGAEAIARALRLAVERQRLERAARKAYATDLATGLPSHAQLLEHMTHLLALREREPAPMALIVLRVDGLARAADALGAEAANVLRRKAAVRLRAALRASDVVASIGADAFAVLLAWIDAPADGQRVAAKLAQSLAEPYRVTGRDQVLAVSAGLALYPEQGREAEALLRRAIGQAAAALPAAPAPRVDRGRDAAVNDE